MQTQNQNNKKKSTPGSVIGLFISIFLLPPALSILIAIGYVVYILLQQRKKSPSPARRQPVADDCPTGPFCFHRDKGEHHVRHGREFDPWDRPDIDISKYQRKR